MRAGILWRWAALVLALALAGCGGVRPCRQGSILVTLVFPDGATADTLELDVAIDGAASKVNMFPLADAGVASGTVELDFPSGWPAGHLVMLSARATAQGQAVAAGETSLTLPDGCATATIALQ